MVYAEDSIDFNDSTFIEREQQNMHHGDANECKNDSEEMDQEEMSPEEAQKRAQIVALGGDD